MSGGTVSRLVRASAWLFVAQLVLGALGWAFLLTPESNVTMLALSLLLLLLLLVVASAALAGTVGIWHGEGLRSGLRQPAAAVPAGLAAGLLVALVWSITGVAHALLVAGEGAIRASLIARFGWADATPLFTAAGWLVAWLRWVVAPLLAGSAFAVWRDAGPADLARSAWVRRAVSPRALLTATAAMYGLVYLPWRWLEWRPAGLPATWVEPAVASAKLAVILLATSTAWALVARVASRPPASTPT
jgi:hypothetical protein